MLSTILIAAAPILMIGLIVWVIWGVASDVKKGASYIDEALPYLSKNDTPIVLAAKKSPPWKLFALGIALFLIGGVFYWYIDNTLIFSTQQKITSVGIMLGGIIFMSLGFRSWHSSRK